MISAIITAAGSGVRMNRATRKQYLLLGGIPILRHTLTVFESCDIIDEIILVIPKEDFAFCNKNIIFPLKSQKKINLVSGGNSRQDSVYNGIMAIKDSNNNSIVIIHDGVRPFVHSDMIISCITGAKNFGACATGIFVNDAVKNVNKSGDITKSLARKNIWLAQTPQAFQYSIIKQAHENAKRDRYVGADDAEIVERLGGINIKINQGKKFNIKITNAEDMALAEAILLRVGKKQREKRKHSRKSCSLFAHYSTENRMYGDFINNVGSGGLFIETRNDFEIGQELKLILSLSNRQKPISVIGKSARHSENGVGIEFDLTQYQQEIINSILEEMTDIPIVSNEKSKQLKNKKPA